MYNNVDANLLQYIFEWKPTKTATKNLPNCSSLKAEYIYAAISAEIYFLVGIEIDFVITN